MGLPRAGRRKTRGVAANRYRAFLWRYVNILELDRGGWLHNIVKVLSEAELCTLDWLICVMQISPQIKIQWGEWALTSEPEQVLQSQ